MGRSEGENINLYRSNVMSVWFFSREFEGKKGKYAWISISIHFSIITGLCYDELFSHCTCIFSRICEKCELNEVYGVYILC